MRQEKLALMFAIRSRTVLFQQFFLFGVIHIQVYEARSGF